MWVLDESSRILSCVCMQIYMVLNTPLLKTQSEIVDLLFCVKKFILHQAVVIRVMFLGLVITKVVFYWASKVFKMALVFVLLDPVKTQVYIFWWFMIECDFGGGLCSGVVNLDLCGGLWVPNIDVTGLQGYIVRRIDVGGTFLDLGRWFYDIMVFMAPLFGGLYEFLLK